MGGPPLSAERACEHIRGLTTKQFLEAIDQLNRAYRGQNRPYRIQPREQGYEMVLQPGYQSVLDHLYGSLRETRLSPACWMCWV